MAYTRYSYAVARKNQTTCKTNLRRMLPVAVHGSVFLRRLYDPLRYFRFCG